MLFQHFLEFGLLAAAFALQIALRVGQFVPAEFQLGLGQFKPVLEIGLLDPLRTASAIGKVFHRCLIGVQLRLRLFDAFLELPGFGRGGKGLRSRVAKGGGKGEIDFVIGQMEGFVAERLFPGRGSQRGQASGLHKRGLIDRSGARLGWSPAALREKGRIAGSAREFQAREGQSNQRQQDNCDRPADRLTHSHRHTVILAEWPMVAAPTTLPFP